MRKLLPERFIWTSLLCSLLFICSGSISNQDDHIKDEHDSLRCALRLRRSQAVHMPNSYVRDSMQPMEVLDEHTLSMDMDHNIHPFGMKDEHNHQGMEHMLPMSVVHERMQSGDMHHEHMQLMDMDQRNLQPMEMQDCIRYKDVNDALVEARKKFRFVPVPVNAKEISNEDIDSVANIIIETTRILAHRFQLTLEEINEALPTIDTSKTDIWDICPRRYKPFHCPITRFRSIDGQCTSLTNSVWGASGTPFRRVLPPDYSNGIDAPRVSPVDGKPLPNVRRVSSSVHPDIMNFNERLSILMMSWGQFIDHDMTLGAFLGEAKFVLLGCCPKKTNPNCMPIAIPKKDPFYARLGEKCMDFQRTVAALRPGCALGPRFQTNLATSRVDASFLYGFTKSLARNLRLGTKGLMKSWPKFHDLGLKDLMPPRTENPDVDCVGRPRSKFCFLAGDERANAQPHVTALQTMYIRQHNRIAEELGYFNPHWDDERIYQETRHVVVAILQHILYNEYLPLVIGPDYMAAFNLTLQKEGYWHGYDKNAPVGSYLPFQTAAFRFGHSLIHGKVRLYNKHHVITNSLDMRNTIQQPFNMYEPGVMDKIILGFLNTPVQASDRFVSTDVSEHLFQPPNMSFGLDLASLNIMRGRDHAIRGYNDYREWCGLPRAKTFEELDHYLANGTALQYAKLYKHPDELELWSAGISEYPVKGGLVGPTFACILGYQFNINRRGDQFWYENPGFPSSFTPAQLQELRKITQAKVICENADDVSTIQKWVMLMPDPVNNPRVFCKDLLDINLEYWIEDPKTETFRYAK